MPKVNLGRNIESEACDEELKGTIGKYCFIRKISITEVMNEVGIKRTTFYDHLEKPSMFRVGEIRAIFDFLRVPKEERGKYL